MPSSVAGAVASSVVGGLMGGGDSGGDGGGGSADIGSMIAALVAANQLRLNARAMSALEGDMNQRKTNLGIDYSKMNDLYDIGLDRYKSASDQFPTEVLANLAGGILNPTADNLDSNRIDFLKALNMWFGEAGNRQSIEDMQRAAAYSSVSDLDTAMRSTYTAMGDPVYASPAMISQLAGNLDETYANDVIRAMNLASSQGYANLAKRGMYDADRSTITSDARDELVRKFAPEFSKAHNKALTDAISTSGLYSDTANKSRADVLAGVAAAFEPATKYNVDLYDPTNPLLKFFGDFPNAMSMQNNADIQRGQLGEQMTMNTMQRTGENLDTLSNLLGQIYSSDADMYSNLMNQWLKANNDAAVAANDLGSAMSPLFNKLGQKIGDVFKGSSVFGDQPWYVGGTAKDGTGGSYTYTGGKGVGVDLGTYTGNNMFGGSYDPSSVLPSFDVSYSAPSGGVWTGSGGGSSTYSGSSSGGGWNWSGGISGGSSGSGPFPGYSW